MVPASGACHSSTPAHLLKNASTSARLLQGVRRAVAAGGRPGVSRSECWWVEAGECEVGAGRLTAHHSPSKQKD